MGGRKHAEAFEEVGRGGEDAAVAADERGWRAASALPQGAMPSPPDLEWRVLSQAPRIYVRDDFLSPEECAYLRSTVVGRLEPAMVVEKAENKYDTQTQVRNNKQVWMSPEEERQRPMLRHILKRMHRAARIPDEDAEALQIGHYSLDQKYELHLDTAPQNDVARPATMIIYLADTEAGGETLFPLGKGRGACSAGWHTTPAGERVYGARNCCEGNFSGMLRVPPRRGRAILFWNHDLTGKVDTLAEHTACPVLAGEKWIAQRWFRYAPYQKIVHPPDPRFDGLPQISPPPTEAPAGRFDVRVLSQKSPMAYLIEDLLSADECRHLVAMAETLEVAEAPEGGMEKRTVPPDVVANDSALLAVVKRMHRAALVPETHAGELQLGRYGPGGSMDLHTDTDPTGRRANAARPVTLLVYLDGDGSAAAGGTTVLPRGMCKDLSACCSNGNLLHVKPKAGRALLLWSHSLSGKPDPSAVHGGCPAGPRGKWVAQLRFLARPHPSLGRYGPDPEFDGAGVLG